MDQTRINIIPIGEYVIYIWSDKYNLRI